MKRNFTPRIGPLALAAAVLLGSTVAFTGAQAQSLDELERRIQEKKEAKAKREAEAAKAEAARRAQELRQATLIVETDAACALSVNGKPLGDLAVGIQEIKVGPGQKLVSCQSLVESEILFKDQVEARSGQDTVLRVQLADRVSQVQRQWRDRNEERKACESEHLMRIHYETHPELGADKMEFKSRHVLLHKEDEARAVIELLNKGVNFGDVAKRYSVDPGSKFQGGDLGWATADQYVRPFAEAILKLKKGEYTSNPVRTDFGYHVIFLDNSRGDYRSADCSE